MKRHRFRDRTKAGRSRAVPYREYEDRTKRHDRRLAVNLANQHKVEAWCMKRGITLTVSNEGHHWIFRGGKKMAEWWPSSAKFVVDKRWPAGIHVHDYQQAMELVEKHLITQ